MQKILVADDEAGIRDLLKSYLVHGGFAVVEASTGLEALAAMRREEPDAVILDLMLPDMGGEEVCEAIRRDSSVPVIMLTAKVGERNLLAGFKAGADDYVTKPFSPRELLARLRALLRRAGAAGGGGTGTGAGGVASGAGTASGSGTAGKDGGRLASPDGRLVLDAGEGRAWRDGAAVDLTGRELRLLEVLLGAPGRVFSREDLGARVLGDDFRGDLRTIDAHVKNLRHKLGDDGVACRFVVTVHGRGYRLEAE